MLREIKSRVEKAPGTRLQNRQQSVSVSQAKLTGLELANILPERHGWPQTIGAVALLEGAGLRDASGKLRSEPVNQILQRLRSLPAVSRVIRWSGRWRTMAYWEKCPDDLVAQIQTARIPAPGDEESLLNICAELVRRPLPLDRALWDVWFLNGLADGRVGLMIRLHHVIADGMSAVTTLASLFDGSTTPAPLGSPGRSDKNRQPDTWTGWRRSWSQLGRLFGEGLAPRTSINRPIGAARRLAVIRHDLAAMKKAAHQQSATVNDILLASITAGLRAVLVSRSEATNRPLRAMVPMAGTAEEGRLLNATAGMLVRLPVAEADPAQLLRLVAADTRLRKEQSVRFAESGIFRSRMAVRLGTLMAARQRVSNIYVANLPGPTMPLTLVGARVMELFPLVSLMGNTTLGIAGLSYAGRFSISVITDRDSWPDLEVLTDAMTAELNWLTGRNQITRDR
jgi:diacylglycerol O-acyltransferase / wax synthase